MMGDDKEAQEIQEFTATVCKEIDKKVQAHGDRVLLVEVDQEALAVWIAMAQGQQPDLEKHPTVKALGLFAANTELHVIPLLNSQINGYQGWRTFQGLPLPKATKLDTILAQLYLSLAIPAPTVH